MDLPSLEEKSYPSSLIPSPFVIDVSDADLRDLSERLARARFTQATAGSWEAGTDPAYLRELVAYWCDTFDWRTRERELNAFPQFTVDIDGERVHFVHVRAPSRDDGREPLALILTHGWPSSFVAMLPLVARLTDPAAEAARPLSAAEQGYLDARRLEKDDDDGYAAIQSTRPDTLAAALLDSPSGLAAWLVEKYRAWGDCGGDVVSDPGVRCESLRHPHDNPCYPRPHVTERDPARAPGNLAGESLRSLVGSAGWTAPPGASNCGHRRS